MAVASLAPCQCYVVSPRRRGRTAPAQQHRTTAAMASNKDAGEPDLFDYFDPLLSPHAYPDGVSPNNKPDETEIPPTMSRQKEQAKKQAVDGDEPDLFDYFDPLLSPHAYPDGISPQHKPDEAMEITNEDRETPTRLYKRSIEAKDVDPNEVFDPTLSPHAYPKGAPSVIVGDWASGRKRVSRVGILLMDHGSRNKASNERLHELARIYEQSTESHVIVKAAHMEIASPSIPEGLESLLKEGVGTLPWARWSETSLVQISLASCSFKDEIVCHPYFLSPAGRHVSEDIPEIVNGAIESLNIDIPVITTEPLGANTSIMLGVIQSIVEESCEVLRYRPLK